jgi:hypothetical protein
MDHWAADQGRCWWQGVRIVERWVLQLGLAAVTGCHGGSVGCPPQPPPGVCETGCSASRWPYGSLTERGHLSAHLTWPVAPGHRVQGEVGTAGAFGHERAHDPLARKAHPLQHAPHREVANGRAGLHPCGPCLRKQPPGEQRDRLRAVAFARSAGSYTTMPISNTPGGKLCAGCPRAWTSPIRRPATSTATSRWPRVHCPERARRRRSRWRARALPGRAPISRRSRAASTPASSSGRNGRRTTCWP